MKAEIFKRGPISCLMDASKTLHAWNGGAAVFSDDMWDPYLQYNDLHWVSIVGWGISQTGEPYWTVRNSWGSYWNKNLFGFWNMKMHDDNLGINWDCNFGVPILPE
eukprot:TRINITY_DN9163_c0_g1_i1.p1 TRINITY_DN9163_c0_g1~~TRINITY_DN9163_c0_g1_i1.p1  ORF type:complete len:106 (+),score=10.14 TRINITY_DN9163_c0_g1_i1:694-1011(+)